ncbi:hypothetical protein CV102_17640 [Natronococcus pandeyae]|uniref:Uncharacterized protein n=1 Tax=Natronococcus pandeyae TaxID=2055836 RepID=A0A8J8TP59_9EURY|nr:hypothetical protein [Natronococcus pandeyae]TYL37431.1 hypothetical protein CV102_17640 [Natronococcus pandeyae]
MTDATFAVTQSKVEQFTRQYLESLGCSIDDRGQEWAVAVPEDANTTIEPGEFTLVRSADEEELDEDERFLHPESTFFQELVEEAADRAPIGSMTLTADDVDIRIPEWITESDAEVGDTSFTPYYDRTALTVLFRVSIETVSEYQTQLLRAISLDIRSKEPVPEITNEYLERTDMGGGDLHERTDELSEERLHDLLTTASEEVQEQVQPDIDEIHDDASRAADVELEDYRRLQEQRISELEEEIARLGDRITELRDTLQQTDAEADRMDVLRRRKQCKEEHDELQAKVQNLRRQREAGFPEKQQEIRNRHALDVTIEPMSLALLDYEKGELEITIRQGRSERTFLVAYGSGVGVTEAVECEICGHELSSENSALLENGDIFGEGCCGMHG